MTGLRSRLVRDSYPRIPDVSMDQPERVSEITGLRTQALGNDPESVRALICDIAARHLDDGVLFEVDGATAAVIRDEGTYSGVRVSMRAELATARPHFHVHVSMGDPIIPAPQELRLPHPSVVRSSCSVTRS